MNIFLDSPTIEEFLLHKNPATFWESDYLVITESICISDVTSLISTNMLDVQCI